MPVELLDFEEPVGVLLKEIEALAPAAESDGEKKAFDAAREPLLAVAEAGARSWPAAATNAVLVWHQKRAAKQRVKLTSAWRRFCVAPQPWQRTLRRV